MFHVYVTTSAGRQVDMGRASFLMDKSILAPLCDQGLTDQQVWDAYCLAHLEKHGTPFGPDVREDWA